MNNINKYELKIIVVLGVILFLRVSGLFMLLPFLPQYGLKMVQVDSFSLSLMLASYGFFQACLQIVLGILSDKVGRKLVLQLGLVILFAGSFVGYVADSIYTLILARSLQGAAAVGSVIFALGFDSVRDSVKPKSTAILGAFIGISFIISIVFAGLLNDTHVRYIFIATMLAALFANLLVSKYIPNVTSNKHFCIKDKLKYLTTQKLLILVLVLLLHASMVWVSCLATELYRENSMILPSNVIVRFSLICISLFLALIIIWNLDNYNQIFGLHFFALIWFIVMGLGFVLFYFAPTQFILFLLLYLCIFTVLETVLPTYFNLGLSNEVRGTLMSIYSTSQFAGVFIGGITSSLLWGGYRIFVIILFLLAVLLWLCLFNKHKN